MKQTLIDFLRDDLLIVSAIYAGCLITTNSLERRRHFTARKLLSYALICLWMFGTSFLWQRKVAMVGIVRYTGLFLMSGLIVEICHRASFCQCLYTIVISYSIQNLCERLIEIPRNVLKEYPILLDRFCLFLMFTTALLLYSQFVTKDARHRTMLNFSKPNQRIMLFMASGVVAVSVVLDIATRGQLSASNPTPGLYVCLSLMSAIFSFLTIVICMSHLRETDSEKRREISMQLLHNEQCRFEQERQVHDAINIKCHDIRHQIAALGKEGYGAELKKIGKLVDVYDATPHTQNAALDVVLSGKMLSCNNQNIQITCLADGRRLNFMEDSDIYALFGNILDNAIDAVRQIQDGEHRIITLNVQSSGDLLRIEEQNFFEGTVYFEQGLPMTSKADKDYHGFGVRSIRALTEKYGGDLKLEAENGIFRLSIMLPIPTSQAA